MYTPEAVSSWSSDFDRTKMSLLSVLAGLWPPAPMQQWNPLLLWQPIPINYLAKDSDYVRMDIWEYHYYSVHVVQDLGKFTRYYVVTVHSPAKCVLSEVLK